MIVNLEVEVMKVEDITEEGVKEVEDFLGCKVCIDKNKDIVICYSFSYAKSIFKNSYILKYKNGSIDIFSEEEYKKLF